MKNLVTVVLIIMLLTISYAVIFCTPKEEFYYMTSTGYSRKNIAKKWDDGFTATMTKIRKGVVAINVDWIDDKWRVNSPLKLGQRIYIEGKGEFLVKILVHLLKQIYILIFGIWIYFMKTKCKLNNIA